MLLWHFFCQQLDTCMHRIASFITFFALVAHGTLGCCAHHAHGQERGAPSWQAACCCGHGQGASAGAEATLRSFVSYADRAACDDHGQPGHKECHETPCVYVAPSNPPGAGIDLCWACAVPVVVDEGASSAALLLAHDLPICGLLLAPRSHFLNRTLLL